MSKIMKKERILYRAQTHWAVLLLPILTITLGIWIANGGLERWLGAGILSATTGAELILSTAREHFGDMDRANFIAGTAVLLTGIVILLARIVKLYLVKVVLTNRRLIMKSGAFRSPVTTVPLGNVDRMEVSRSLLGRILNYGRVRIVRANQVAYHFHWLASPGKFNANFNWALRNMLTGSLK